MNTIPVAASPVGRVGKKVDLKCIAIRGNVVAASSGTVHKCALMLVWIRSPNQAATLPAWTEIQVSQGSSSLTNRDGAPKFKILRRWDFTVTGNSTTPATGNEERSFEEFINLRGKQSDWTNASVAGTIGEFEKGALLLMGTGSSVFGATNTPVGSFNCRLYFTDP